MLTHSTHRRHRRRVYPRDITEQEYADLWETIFHESGERIPDYEAEEHVQDDHHIWRDQ